MENPNETEVEAVVLDTGDGETLLVDLPNGEGEENDEGKSDAVAIAEIEAEKEIAIAAIESNTATAVAEASAEVAVAQIEAETERVTSWQEETENLRKEITELNLRVDSLLTGLQSPSTPTPHSEAEPLEIAAEVATEIAEAEANNSTPEFMSPPTSETVTEVTLESEDGKPEAEATVHVRKRRRLI